MQSNRIIWMRVESNRIKYIYILGNGVKSNRCMEWSPAGVGDDFSLLGGTRVGGACSFVAFCEEIETGCRVRAGERDASSLWK